METPQHLSQKLNGFSYFIFAAFRSHAATVRLFLVEHKPWLQLISTIRIAVAVLNLGHLGIAKHAAFPEREHVHCTIQCHAAEGW